MDTTPIWISLKVALSATAVIFLVCVYLARWRTRHNGIFPHLVDGFSILPIALPPTVVGLILLILFGRNSLFTSLTNVQVLFTWQAAALASMVVSFPLMYLTAKASFQQLDPALLDLARIEGVSEFRILWKVMVPAAWPGLTAGVVISFVRSLGEFGATLMVAGNIPETTRTLPVAIFFAVETGDHSAAISLALISVSLSLGAVLLLGFLDHIIQTRR